MNPETGWYLFDPVKHKYIEFRATSVFWGEYDEVKPLQYHAQAIHFQLKVPHLEIYYVTP